MDTDFSGTTLVSVCIRGTQLLLTNVGDSRITLGRRLVPGENGFVGGEHAAWRAMGRGPLVAQPLTEDHKPDTPAEVRVCVDVFLVEIYIAQSVVSRDEELAIRRSLLIQIRLEFPRRRASFSLIVKCTRACVWKI